MEEKNRKNVLGDLGLVDEILELCKNLVSVESHAFGSYVSSKNNKWLKISKKARLAETRGCCFYLRSVLRRRFLSLSYRTRSPTLRYGLLERAIVALSISPLRLLAGRKIPCAT